MVGINQSASRYVSRVPVLGDVLASTVRKRGHQQAIRLSTQSDGTVRAVATAISEALGKTTSLEEGPVIDQLESLRRKLKSSQTKLSIVDYGAGEPDSHFSDEQMSAGRNAVTTVGHVCRKACQPPFWSLLLFKIIRQVKPTVCLELGTAIGISGSYQAAALKLNSSGRLISLEGSESLASVARQNFDILGLDNAAVVVGRFQDTLPKVVKECQPIDFAFIDGHHDGNATLAYFDQIYPSLSARAVVVFDDIAWYASMRAAWATVEGDTRVGTSFDLFSRGICIMRGAGGTKQRLRIPLNGVR